MTPGTKIPADDSLEGDGIPVVDRRGEPIGTKCGPLRGDGEIGVALTDTLHHLLGLEEATVTLPARWVAGVRRDEIRLSKTVHDPAFPDGVTVMENVGSSLGADPGDETPVLQEGGGPGPLRVPRTQAGPQIREEDSLGERGPTTDP